MLKFRPSEIAVAIYCSFMIWLSTCFYWYRAFSEQPKETLIFVSFFICITWVGSKQIYFIFQFIDDVGHHRLPEVFEKKKSIFNKK